MLVLASQKLNVMRTAKRIPVIFKMGFALNVHLGSLSPPWANAKKYSNATSIVLPGILLQAATQSLARASLALQAIVLLQPGPVRQNTHAMLVVRLLGPLASP